MKVIVSEFNTFQRLGSKKEVVADIPLKMECIDKFNIRLVKEEYCCNSYSDVMILPYADPELIEALKLDVIFNLAMNADWQGGYSKIQMSIIVEEGCNGFNAYLAIRVFPYEYSAEERDEILRTADKEPDFPNSEDEYEREWSEYNNWVSIFQAIDYRKARIESTHQYVYMRSEKDVFELKLKQKETVQLLGFLYKHMLMVNNGAWYLTEEEAAKKKEEREELYKKNWQESQRMSEEEFNELLREKAEKGELYPSHFPTNQF